MTTGIRSAASGTFGALTFGGYDAITFDATGIKTGLPALGKRLVQLLTTQVGTVATGITVIPADNTIPQITEGDQYMALSITPQSVNSTLEVEVEFFGTNSVTTASLTAALFRDSTANALAVSAQTVSTGDHTVGLKFKWIGSAASLAATTFKVRAGGNVAGTTTFNGTAGNQFYGGAYASRLTIKEYLP